MLPETVSILNVANLVQKGICSACLFHIISTEAAFCKHMIQQLYWPTLWLASLAENSLKAPNNWDTLSSSLWANVANYTLVLCFQQKSMDFEAISFYVWLENAKMKTSLHTPLCFTKRLSQWRRGDLPLSSDWCLSYIDFSMEISVIGQAEAELQFRLWGHGD